MAQGCEDTLALPLLGVPLGVKDNLCTEGVPTTAASRILEGYRPSYDASVVSKLKLAGGIAVSLGSPRTCRRGQTRKSLCSAPDQQSGVHRLEPTVSEELQGQLPPARMFGTSSNHSIRMRRPEDLAERGHPQLEEIYLGWFPPKTIGSSWCSKRLKAQPSSCQHAHVHAPVSHVSTILCEEIFCLNIPKRVDFVTVFFFCLGSARQDEHGRVWHGIDNRNIGLPGH